DGDTGSNMLLTMQAAVASGQSAVLEGAGAGVVAAQIARGALLNARGNSGIILSQIIHGFSLAIEDRTAIDGHDLANGLDRARELAYRAVLEPVEGTMLTVIRVAAEYAQQAASRTASLAPILAAAVEGAKRSLETTPELLAILKQAGVVDAGGQGIVRLLEGLERYARGETDFSGSGEDAIPTDALPDLAASGLLDTLHNTSSYGYCTNFIVWGEEINVERCRADLAAMGDSVVVVGDDQLLKVHIHTLHPGKILEYAVQLGDLDQIKIDNMQVQARAVAERRLARPSPVTPDRVPAIAETNATPERLTVVAVVAGDGIAKALQSMGAGVIVAGGKTMNPSVQELLTAVEQAPSGEVILLPNNPNIVLTANQIPGLTQKQVAVVPSRSIPQGIAALSALSQDLGLSENSRRMTGALRTVRSVEITRATRDAKFDDIEVKHGQCIGLVDNRLVAAGDDPIDVTLDSIRQASPESAELLTIFWGELATTEEATALAEATRSAWPAHVIEFHAGGQPHYLYTIAVE
ncbi:MAG: DAK2 domain-containing protein, partial [Chloroflexota bacterium]|nr:DAK2 domain-containing protein [Chloroflexota bacterium]